MGNEVIPDIEQILPLAKRDFVFGHYDNIMLRGVCNQLVGAIGWYMVCQIISGMVLIPMIAWKSHRYLSEVAAEAKSKHAAKEESRTLMDERKMLPEPSKRGNLWNCCVAGESTSRVPELVEQ